MSQMFSMVVRATGEVRDAEGNLISSSPIEFRHEVPEEHLRALGATDEDIEAINRGEGQ